VEQTIELEVLEMTSATAHEAALAILKNHGSQRYAIVWPQMKFILGT
jgi:hypothetical protein